MSTPVRLQFSRNDRPIIFSAPMVRALIEGRKTQTRRIIRPQPREPIFIAGSWLDEARGERKITPYAIGDRLWVREAYYRTDDGEYEHVIFAADSDEVAEHLDGIARLKTSHPSAVATWEKHEKRRPSIHMPRWASRLTLLVTDVRVQRLQEISKGDVIAEGITNREGAPIADCVAGWHEPFAQLWDKLHGDGAWGENPWIVALTFSVHKANIDALANAPICEEVG